MYYEKNPFDFVYDRDLSRPGTDSQPNTSNDLRLTWQISPKNKLSAYYNYAPRETDHWIVSNTRQPEASNFQNVTLNHFETLTFKSTLSSKMLLDVGFGNTSETWTREPVRDAKTSRGYPVTEQTTGVNFRAYSGTFSENFTAVRSYRASLSYVPGSHAFKVGFNLIEGPARTHVWTSYDTALTVRNALPFAVTVRTTPYTTRERLVADLGLYAQDTWTISTIHNGSTASGSGLRGILSEADQPSARLRRSAEALAEAEASRPPLCSGGCDALASLKGSEIKSHGIRVRRGYDETSPFEPLARDDDGAFLVRTDALERIEIDFGDTATQTTDDGRRTTLVSAQPIGSSFDQASGVFVWQPGPGFVGSYELVFLRGGERQPLAVRVVLGPYE